MWSTRSERNSSFKIIRSNYVETAIRIPDLLSETEVNEQQLTISFIEYHILGFNVSMHNAGKHEFLKYFDTLFEYIVE